MYKNRIKYRINNPLTELFLLFIILVDASEVFFSCSQQVLMGVNVAKKGFGSNVFSAKILMKIVAAEC